MPRAALLLATVAVCCATIGCPHEPPSPPPTTTRASSQPTTGSAPSPTVETKVLKTLLDVTRADDAAFPTTQPLDENLELAAAARIRLTEPTYLCSRGDLWISRADAAATPDVLALARKTQTHVTRERVKFIYWRPTGTPWSPEVIAQDVDASVDAAALSADVWVTPTARLPLDRSIARDWSRAGAWNTDAVQAAVVPCATGVSVIRVDHDKLDEQFIKLVDVASPGVTTHYALDPRGLLAWSVDPVGPSAVARFVDGKWTLLTPDPVWPEHLLHVVPFLDGTVLAIAQEGDSIKLKSVALESIGVDEPRVLQLVKLLANRKPETREKAQADLAQIGPGAWPVLRRLAPTQPAEARVRIRALLGNETTPTLAGISPEPGAGRLVRRLPDGGVLLYFAEGASAVAANGVVQRFAPAWLSVKATEPARRLPENFTNELRPDDAGIVNWGDEWIFEHDVDGPLRWMGNHTEPLITKTEAAEFKRFAGIDSAGRWLFKTTQADGPTLIIDPTLPDPRPKLPVWTIQPASGIVGWNDEGWPIIKRGQGAWILKDGAWNTLDAKAADATLRTTPATPTAATSPATRPTTLLTDAAGNVYSDGLHTLAVVRKDGTRLIWPLPTEATGSGAIGDAAILIEADGKLFLANAPGRLLRIAPQLDQPTPFKLEAVFTRHLPTTDVRRIWKDPVGRIIYASRGSTLSICFPNGRINGAMSNLIPAGALREALATEAGDPSDLVPEK